MKASLACPPYWEGAARRRARAVNSRNELGQPWVNTIGRASGSSPSNLRKCTADRSREAM